MKYYSVTDIDRFIDTNLFVFPYIDDVKESLEKGELDDINEYASELKKQLKLINKGLKRKERQELNFYPKNIKYMFDCIMFKYYEKSFFDALNKLLSQHNGYTRNLIEEFIYKKENEAGYIVLEADKYLGKLKNISRIVSLRNEGKKKR